MSEGLNPSIIEEMRYALRIKRVNEEMLEYLSSSLRWLMRYADKQGIQLPEKERILSIVESVMVLAEKIPTSSPAVKQPRKYPEDEAEPRRGSET